MTKNEELERQEQFPWSRSTFHTNYNGHIARYKMMSILELARGDKLLDLACGDGTITELLAPQFKVVVGVDAAERHLSEARKRVPQGQFYHSLIEDFETDERFDTIILSDLLEHVEDPVVVLKKAASLLSESGVVISHVPNSNAINRKIAVTMGTLKYLEELSPFDLNIAGHRRYYNMVTLRKDFEQAGLSIRKEGGIFLKMLSTPQMDWLLANGPWQSGHGWGRSDQPDGDWATRFCDACYEIGKERPEDCNLIYVCGSRTESELSAGKHDFEQFAAERTKNIAAIRSDKDISSLLTTFFEKTGSYKYTYNFDWCGLPIIQMPTDVVALQEVIWSCKPEVIVETGIARGGSLIFSASMLNLLNNAGRVIGVEVGLKPWNRSAILNHPFGRQIDIVDGSSTDPATVDAVKRLIGPSKKVMVLLDSDHTHRHVLEELKLYSQLVSVGSYIIVFDSTIEFMPGGYYKDRNWGKGNSPYTAIEEFLSQNRNFVRESAIDDKLVITTAKGGWLKRVS